MNEQLRRIRERLQDAVEGTSCNVEDMIHYFENKCVPTLDEVNNSANADSNLRLAIDLFDEFLKEIRGSEK